MNPGNVGAPCSSDFVEITLPDGSENVNIGKLCGENTMQHLYIHFLDTKGAKSVRIDIRARIRSQYRIKLQQVSYSIYPAISEGDSN